MRCLQVLLISPKNSPAAIEHLLRTSKATILLVDSSGSRVFDKSIPGMSILSFVGLETSTDGFAPALIPLTREEVQLEMDLPAFYLHTSGSTGEFFNVDGYKCSIRIVEIQLKY